jgi:trimethylamine--corrinoid protein Co-methyltransferase
VLEEALKYGFPVNFAPMPILGATAPMTPAGAAIVAAAEILGCMTATSLIDPDVYYFFTSITGEMDMKTTQVCYGTPAAILTDVALHQLFRRRYGLVHNVEPGYVEAKSPACKRHF